MFSDLTDIDNEILRLKGSRLRPLDGHFSEMYLKLSAREEAAIRESTCAGQWDDIKHTKAIAARAGRFLPENTIGIYHSVTLIRE